MLGCNYNVTSSIITIEKLRNKHLQMKIWEKIKVLHRFFSDLLFLHTCTHMSCSTSNQMLKSVLHVIK